MVNDLEGFKSMEKPWFDLIEDLQNRFQGKNLENDIGELVFVASLYHLWIERIERIFKKVNRKPNDIVNGILNYNRDQNHN